MVSRKKRFLAGIAVAIAVGVVLSLAFGFDLFVTVQRQAGDFMFRAASSGERDGAVGEIVLVVIDDASLQRLGRLGDWSRSIHASLVDRLVSAGARVIVFDVLFSEPAPGDAALAAAMRRAGNVVLPVTHLDSPPPGVSDSLLRPLPVLAEAAAATGHANVTPDSDGVVRRLPAVLGWGDGYQPALALAAAGKYLRRAEGVPPPRDGIIAFAGRSIPVGANNGMLVNYASEPETGAAARFARKSFIEVLDGDFDASFFRGRMVIVGVTAAGLGDTFWTPVGKLTGAEIHASAVSMVFAGNFLKPAPAPFTVALVLLLAVACGLAVLRFRMLPAALTALSLCIVYFLGAFTLFDRGILMNMLYPPATIIVTFFVANLYLAASVQSEKREITRLFGRYVSPAVVEKTLQALDRGTLKLGGEEQEVTVAFFDVRGFTGLCEETAPDVVVRALNAYMSAIVDAVMRHGGLVNKFGGDSVMAVWNAPVPCAEHAMHAVQAALEAQEAIAGLREKSALPSMEFGAGINSGRAVAGNIGSEDRLEYSVIGDAVNTAFRLASAAPGGRVWVSATTFQMASERLPAKPVGSLSVRGKKEPVEAFEIESQPVKPHGM